MRKLRPILASIALLLATCKPPAAPAPDSQPAKVMAIVVPGLGTPQTGDVVAMLRAGFPSLNVVDFGTGHDSYLSDVQSYIASNAHAGLILIGHSYGTSKISQVLAAVGPVKLVVYLDPVQEVGVPNFVIPANVEKCVVVTGDWSGLFRASISDRMKSSRSMLAMCRWHTIREH